MLQPVSSLPSDDVHDETQICPTKLLHAKKLLDINRAAKCSSQFGFCVGCAIVQADNAPDCGVAQGVIHGVPVRHGEKEEEEEGEVEQEVEGNKEEEKSNTSAHVHG